MENFYSFRIRLKELRENKGISQYKLADELNVSQSAIGSWEAGTRECNFSMLAKIAQYFNVPVDYLLGVENSVFAAEDYADGVRNTKKVSITADQEEVFDKTNEVLDLLGDKGKELIIDFCDMLLEKFGR